MNHSFAVIGDLEIKLHQLLLSFMDFTLADVTVLEGLDFGGRGAKKFQREKPPADLESDLLSEPIEEEFRQRQKKRNIILQKFAKDYFLELEEHWATLDKVCLLATWKR